MDVPTTPSRRRRAPRKTDAERGPLGAWSYGTRDLLSLSDAQVAEAAGVSVATVRKIDGGSMRKPAKRVVLRMAAYFREVGARLDLPVENPPAEYMAGDPTRDTLGPPAALASALAAQAASMARMLEFAIDRDRSVEARIRLLEGEVRTLREQLGVEGPPGQSTPPQTEGSAG